MQKPSLGNMQNHPEFHRRYLPHWHPGSGAFFITFRLFDSLPLHTLTELQRKLEIELTRHSDTPENPHYTDNCYKKHFARFDTALDTEASGNHYLKQPEAAKIVANALAHYDGKEYDLVCFCIMSNHVHVLYTLLEDSRDISEIMHSIKRFTARELNKLFKREGQFWQHESYDRVVRNQKEFENIIRYILNNPVKAGLVESWEKYPYTYWRDQ